LDLKTVEGGFVTARRLTYGEKLTRRAMVSSMKLGDGENGKDFAAEVRLVNEVATLYDFQHCVVDSNLTKPNLAAPDDEEQDLPLNFKDAADVRALDPRTGEEISEWLDSLNNYEVDSGN